MQADQSRFVTVLDGEGDAAEGEANFASKKASKHFKTTIYIKWVEQEHQKLHQHSKLTTPNIEIEHATNLVTTLPTQKTTQNSDCTTADTTS